MLNRFNFYDIYGFFIPGLIAVGLLGPPLLWIAGLSFQVQFTTGLIVIVLSYVAGLLIHEIGRDLVPSRFSFTSDGKRSFGAELRFPGDYLFDASTGGWSLAFKQATAARVEQEFGFILRVVDVPDKDQSRTRNDAMMVCRDRLVASGVAAYPEQFQGMYGMFRGIGFGFGLAACGWLGWFTGSSLSGGVVLSVGTGCAAVALVAIAAIDRRFKEAAIGKWLTQRRATPSALCEAVFAVCIIATIAAAAGSPWLAVPFACAAAIALAVVLGEFGLIAFLGMTFCANSNQSPTSFLLFAVPAVAGLLALLSSRALKSYHRFAEEFARSVFRSFHFANLTNSVEARRLGSSAPEEWEQRQAPTG